MIHGPGPLVRLCLARSRGINLDQELRVAIDLARVAGRFVRDLQGAVLERRVKQGGEVVTRADLEADSLIRTRLRAEFPNDVVLSEEGPDLSAASRTDRVWIVDPIDSTSTFLLGGDEYCVSIGLAVGGRSVLGAVYNPARGELFSGIDGQGMSLNGVPAWATSRADPGSARITVSAKEFEAGLRRLSPRLPLHPMASMAYKLARVGAGLDEGVVSLKFRREWGVCAGVALVAAGAGVATQLHGDAVTFGQAGLRHVAGIVAAGRRLHPLLLAEAKASGIDRYRL